MYFAIPQKDSYQHIPTIHFHVPTSSFQLFRGQHVETPIPIYWIFTHMDHGFMGHVGKYSIHYWPNYKISPTYTRYRFPIVCLKISGISLTFHHPKIHILRIWGLFGGSKGRLLSASAKAAQVTASPWPRKRRSRVFLSTSMTALVKVKGMGKPGEQKLVSNIYLVAGWTNPFLEIWNISQNGNLPQVIIQKKMVDPEG